MTDKEKIRKEVERLQDLTMDENKNFYSEAAEGEYNALCNIGHFIDSLQEEPIFKVGDTIQKKNNNSIRYSIINKTSEGYRALRGLSDTIVIWFSEQDQWKLVEEPVSEELEEASKEWLAPQLDKSYANYGETKMMELTHFDGYAMLDAIEFGAKWQKGKG